MQRLRRFLYILAYGSVVGTLLSILCWTVVMAAVWVGPTFIYDISNPDAPGLDLSIILRALLYGGFIGLAIGAQLSVWTGVTTGLAAATMTSLFAFPLKNPVLYKRLMQIVCTVFGTVCTLLVARGEFGGAEYPIMTIPIAAFVALLLSRRLATWSIARSLAIQ
jgi:hypothetical protein